MADARTLAILLNDSASIRRQLIDAQQQINIAATGFANLNSNAARLRAIGQAMQQHKTMANRFAPAVASAAALFDKSARHRGIIGQAMQQHRIMANKLSPAVASAAALFDKSAKHRGIIGQAMQQHGIMANSLSPAVASAAALFDKSAKHRGIIGQAMQQHGIMANKLASAAALLNEIAEHWRVIRQGLQPNAFREIRQCYSEDTFSNTVLSMSAPTREPMVPQRHYEELESELIRERRQNQKLRRMIRWMLINEADTE